jgi:hypothetical protein
MRARLGPGLVELSDRPEFQSQYRVRLDDAGVASPPVTVFAAPATEIVFGYDAKSTRVILRIRTPRTYPGTSARVRAADTPIYFYARTPKGSKRYKRVGVARLRAAGRGNQQTWDAVVRVTNKGRYRGERFLACWPQPPIVGTCPALLPSTCGDRTLPLKGVRPRR